MNYREKTKNELIIELEVLKQEFEAFKTSFNKEIVEREKMEFSLRERMKELRCHNEITAILSNANLTIDDMVEKIIQIIPDSMQFPEIAGVSINIHDKIFETQNLSKSKYTLRQQIISDFKIVGHLEVSYAEALLPPAKQIFLPEEKDLLFSVAQRIGGFIEKMERENTLIQNHTTLQKIIETINDVIYEISADNVIKYVSPSIEKLVGYKPDELIGERFLKFVYEPDLPIVLESFALLPGIIFPYIEYRFVAKNGGLCWIRSSASIIFDNGKMVGVTGSITNITHQKQIETELQKSESLYRSILNASPDVITITDLEGKIQFASPRALEMFGYDNIESINGHTILEFVIPEFHEKAVYGISQMLRGNLTGAEEYVAVRKDGSTFNVEINGEFVRDEHGTPQKMIFITRDISDRKMAEEKLRLNEERFRYLVESIKDVIYEIDSDGSIKYVSPSINQIIGYDQNELIGRNFLEFTHPDDRPDLINALKNLKSKIYPYFEYRFVAKNGTIRWVRSSTTAIFKDGIMIGGNGSMTDITEWKIAKDALTESEEKYRLMFFDNPQPMVIYDSETLAFLEVNEAAIKQYGYSRAEFMQLSITDLHTPDDIAKVIEDVELSKNDQNSMSEWKHFGKDKTRFDVELTSHSVNFEGRKARHVLINDITARKQAEEAVRVSSKKWEAIISASPDGIGMISLDGKLQLISEKLALMYGYSTEEKDAFIGKSVIDFIDSSDHKLLKENIRKLLSGTKNHLINEYIAIRKDKSRFFTELNSTVLFDSDGKPTNILYVQRDITDRKQAENELLQREELLDSIIETARDSIFIKDASLTYIKVNKAMASLLGMSKEEIAGKSDMELFGAESGNHTEEIDRQVLLGETVEEFPSKPVNGEIKHFHTIKVPLKDAYGQIYGLCGIARNITESKQAEKALRSSEERFRAISEYSSSSICILSTAGKVIWINDAMLRMTGYSPEQVYSAESFTSFLAPESVEFVITNFMKFANHQDYEHHYEFSIIRADGEKRLCEKFMSHYQDQNGKLNLIISMTDITERHQAEQALHNNRLELIASNNQLEMAQRIGHTGSWVFDIETQKIWGSSEAKRLLGFDKNEEYFTLEAIEACISDRERIHQALVDLINNDIPYDLEYELHPADGSSPKTIQSKARVEKDQAGNIISIIGVIQDITERTLAEQNLVDSEEKFRTIAEQTSDFISIADSNGHITYASPASVSVFNISPEAMIGRNFIQFVAEYEIARAIQTFGDCLENDSAIKNAEFVMKRADGTIFIGELNASKFQTGTQFGTLVTIRDITERKNSETALKQSEIKFRSIFESIQDTYFEASLEGILLEVSPAIEIISKGQYSRDEMIGKSFAGIYANPDIRDAYFSQLFNQQRVTDYELLLKNKDGSLIPVSVSAALSFDEEGKPAKITGSLRDITERKLAEKALIASEEKYRLLFYNNPQPMWIYDIETLAFLEVNQAAITHYGYSRDEFLSMTLRDIRPAEDIDDLMKDVELSKNNKSTQTEWRHIRKNKELRIVEITAQSLIFNGRSARHVLINDITDRKNAEETLKRNEDDLNYAQEIARMGSWELDLITNKYSWSRNNYKLVGLKPYEKEVTVEFFMKMLHPDDVRVLNENIHSVLTNKKAVTMDIRIIMPDGQIVWIQNNVVPVFDGDSIVALKGVNIDITAKKLAEEELHKLSLAVEQSPVMIIITDPEGNIEYANPKSFELTGFTKEELIGKNPRILNSGDKPKEEYEILWQNLKSGKEWRGEFHNKKKNGELFWLSSSLSPIFDNAGKIAHLLAIQEDITDRKKAEETLKQSEAELNYSQEIAKMGSWKLDLITDKVTWSKNYYQLIERDPDRNELTNHDFFKTVHPDDQHLLDEKLIEIQQSRKAESIDLRLIMPDGRIKWIQNNIVPELDGDKLISLKGVNIDITAKKLAEENIKQQNQRLQAIISTLPDIIFVIDKDGVYHECYCSTPELLLVTPEQIIGTNLKNVFTKDQAQIHLEKIQECIDTKKIIMYEYSIANLEKVDYFEARLAPFGKDRVLTLVRDITQRKQAEQEIRDLNENLETKIVVRTIQLEETNEILENEIQNRMLVETELALEKHRLSDIIEGTNVGTWEWNIQTGMTIFNERWAEIIGYTLDEISPVSIETWEKFAHPDDLKRSGELLEKHFNGELAYYSFESRMKHKNGEWVWVLDRGKVHDWDMDHKPLMMSGTHQDISVRKMAEAALLESQEQLNLVIKGSNDAPWDWNLVTDQLFYSLKWWQQIGYSPEEIPSDSNLWRNLTHPDDIERVNNIFTNALASENESYEAEFRLLHKNGWYVPVLSRGFISRDENGKPIRVTGTNMDLTERKRAEEVLLWNQTLMQLMANSSPLGFLVVDNRTDNILYFNHRFCEIWEITHIEDQMQRGELKNNDIIPYCLPVLADVPAFAESCKPLQYEDNRVVIEDEIAFIENRTVRRFTTQIRSIGDEYFGRFYIFEDISKRKRASEFETELLQLSLQLTGIPNDEIPAALNLALQKIGGFLGADRAYIFEINEAEKTMSNTFEWCNEGINPEIENLKNIPVDTLPDWMVLLQKHENIVIPLVKDLPADRAAEREILELQGIQSLVIIPIFIGNTLIGFVGLDSVNNKREYNVSEINILQVWSNMLASLINHRRQDDLIEQTRHNYETFFNTIDDFLFVLDEQGNVIHANKTVIRRLGYSTEELLEKSVLIVHPAERREEAGRIVGEMLAGTTDFCPVPLVTKSGDYIPVETRVKPGFWDSKPVIFGVTKDVSQIKLSEEKFSKAFQFNSALMAISDLNGQFLDVNDTFLKTLGFLREEVIGNDVIPPNLFVDTDFVDTINEKMRQGIPVREIESKIRTKTGEIRIGLFSADTIYIGKDLCLLTMMVDITERKQAEEKIHQARDEAEKANRAKSEFLSRMSHELRTPMNSILGFAQLMEMGELNPSQKKGVKHILNSGKHLLNLINEVLDISRIEAGRVSLSMEPIQVGGVIMEILDTMQPNAAKLNLKTELQNSPDNKLFVVADHQRLKQVLLNLLANAFKYNINGGSVTVRTALMQKQEPDISTIRISISDTGKGINAEDLNKLFQPFERIGAEKGETEGTGLGLTVVKKLMEIMDGTIGVESQPGHGSTFWIELPLAESQKNLAEQTEWALKQEVGLVKKAGTILYIEDNVSNIELVEQILTIQRPGNHLIANMTGGQAVSLAIEYMPDLILLDLDLPDIHGSEVLKNLQAEAKTNAIPVIIISADAMPERIQKLTSAGVKGYLTKPLDIVEFLRMVDEYIK